jgi:opacity protein-like surface antigen
MHLFGCASGQYEIGQGDIKDTTKFKSTGAKLKNFYKIKSPPYFTLQISAGPNLGMAELSSNYSSNFDAEQFEDGQNFGVKSGFGFMVIGKFSLHKQGNVRLNASTGYNRFQSDFFTKESPYGKVGYNVLSVGIGLENSFSPSFRLKPYIAGEIQANMISGQASINDLQAGTSRDVTITNSFRIGYMIYSGVEYMLSDRMGLNLGLKVTNANQVLKSSTADTNPNEVSLRDKKVINGPLEFGGFKNFTYTTLFFGVNFYMGVQDIVYQFNK